MQARAADCGQRLRDARPLQALQYAAVGPVYTDSRMTQGRTTEICQLRNARGRISGAVRGFLEGG